MPANRAAIGRNDDIAACCGCCLSLVGRLQLQEVGEWVMKIRQKTTHTNDICPLSETLRTGYHALAGHTHYDKDGRKIYVEVSTSPIRNEKGEIAQVIHIARNITKRKRAEEALREPEEKYCGLVTNVKLGIFRHSAEVGGRILEANPAMEEITGYSRDELLGKQVFDLYVHPEERESFLRRT
ncbi:PAS domain-containing protein [Dehalococcoidia bacterium]|nr:PAS domain-containing protein [Dehalococcoidia bacterium]